MVLLAHGGTDPRHRAADDFVTERRRALNISRTQMFARGGPSPSTMNKALTGARGLTRSTLRSHRPCPGLGPGLGGSRDGRGYPDLADPSLRR